MLISGQNSPAQKVEPPYRFDYSIILLQNLERD